MTGVGLGVWRLLTAPRHERRVIVAAVRITPAISRSLRRSGYRSTRLWLQQQARPNVPTPLSTSTLVRVDKAIRSLPWDMKCLERSLAVWWLAGDDSVIRLGVAPPSNGGEHRFHAWVERDGRVVNDDPHVKDEYLPLIGHAIESADPGLFD